MMEAAGRRMTPHVGQMVLVRKLDYATGHVLLSWPGTLLELNDQRAVVRAPFAGLGPDPVTVDGVPFLAGDTFTEFYFLACWYNVFHIADADGRRKGWYCNVTRPPTVDESAISFVDLALDLFAHPDGSFAVLDEDDFAAASEQLYSSDDVAQARLAIDKLADLARGGRLPTPDDVR